MKFPNSLSFRLLSIIAVWTAIALVVTGGLLSTLFRQNAEKNFDELLLAHAFNLMGAIDTNQSGNIAGTPNLGDPRFQAPLSGWYWAVSKANTPSKPLLFSRSLGGAQLSVKPANELPFDQLFRRLYNLEDSSTDAVTRVLEAQLFVGDSDTLFQVSVAGNLVEIYGSISDFNRSLIIFFALFWAGLIIATYFAIRIGLKPLGRAASGLVDIREGRAEMLKGEFPTEITPLATEINSLITANRSVLERARTQVGNLAHALKTPLAVIFNEVREVTPQTPARVEEQAQSMQAQVETYLNRARIAAQRGGLTARTPVRPVVEQLVRVMRKINPEIEFIHLESEQDPIFQGEKQDLEELLGNVLENAARYSNSKVRVLFDKSSDVSNPRLTLTIEDDGPGLSPEEAQQALKRGRRLDETKPGSGLGLSIVHDIVEEYAGELVLEKSEMGGLKLVIFLPMIPLK